MREARHWVGALRRELCEAGGLWQGGGLEEPSLLRNGGLEVEAVEEVVEAVEEEVVEVEAVEEEALLQELCQGRGDHEDFFLAVAEVRQGG